MSAALYTLAAAALLAAGGMLASHQHLATTIHEHPHLAAPVTRLRPRDPDRLLIFVGGLQRSGTTALASALEALPDASGQSWRKVSRRKAAPASSPPSAGAAAGGATGARWAVG